jgi:hypothetical protein
MMNHMTKGVLAARALALVIVSAGISVGPGGVASATPMRAPAAGDALSNGGAALASRSPLGNRGAAAWDDDSGDGGEGDDGGDDDDS